MEKGEEGGPTISSQPLLTDDPQGPSASRERWIGGMGLTGPSTQDSSLRCPPAWGPTSSRGGHPAPWTLDTTSRTPQTRPAARRSSVFVRSSPAPPPCGPLPPAVGYQRLGSNRPPAGLAPARPCSPSPAPPPTCCLRGGFHLHLPLTLRPARTPAPHRPAPGPPQPAHQPTAPRGSAPDPQ